MSYVLVEPCCGSAAFTLHLLGARHATLPYQGSKWRFRHSLQAHAERLGFVGAPKRVELTDPGPWGRALPEILKGPNPLERLILFLKGLNRMDPGEAYRVLQSRVVPLGAPEFAGEFLFLQRLAFSGKAVGVKGGCWASPGFNKTSAYGTPATNRFGTVNPMIPSLIRVLRGYQDTLKPVEVQVRNLSAKPPGALDEIAGPTLVYLDPPYEGTTTYPNGQMTREEVVELARAWHHKGASVIVSEQHGLDLPGWDRSRLYPGRGDTSPFRGKQEEWVTTSPEFS